MPLNEEQRETLDLGVKKMIEAGASEEDVMAYAEDFNRNFQSHTPPPVKKKDATESASDDGLSVYQKISGGKSVISEGLAGKYDKEKEEPMPMGAMETSLVGPGGVPAELYASSYIAPLDEEQRREVLESASEDEASKEVVDRALGQWVKDQVESDPFSRKEDYFIKLLEIDPDTKKRALKEATATPEEKYSKQIKQSVKDELLSSGVDYTFVNQMSPNEIAGFITSRDNSDVFDLMPGIDRNWAWMSSDKSGEELYRTNFVEEAVLNPNGRGLDLGPAVGGAIEVGERISPTVPRYVQGIAPDIIIGQNIKYAAEDGRANKWFANRTTDLRKWSDALNKKWSAYADAVEQHNNATYTNEELAKKVERDLNAERLNLLKQQRFIDYSGERLSNLKEGFNDVYTKEYLKKKEQEGGVVSSTFKSFQDGFVGMSKAVPSIGLDIMTTLPAFNEMIGDPDSYELERAGGDVQKAKASAAKREMLGMFDKASETMSGVSEEYMNSEDRGILQQGWNAAINSIGTAVSGGGVGNLSKAAFFAMSYNQFDKEMSSEEFDSMSTAQKMAIAGTYGMVVSYFERLGFKMSTGALKNFKGIDRFVAETLDMVPTGASPQMIQRAIDNNLAAKMGSGLLKIEAGALVETATEDAQLLGEIAIKHLSNKLNDYEYFQNVPSTSDEIISAVWEETKVAFVASQVFGFGGAAVSTVREGVSNRTSDLAFQTQMDILMDNQLRSQAYEAINKRVSDGVFKRCLKK
jgi:hypothetical protein